MTRKERALATKKKISDAAHVLFIENGYEAITVNDIIKKAEVSVGAFYHHFDSKEAVANSIYEFEDINTEQLMNDFSPSDPLSALIFFFESRFTVSVKIGSAFVNFYYRNQLAFKDKAILDKERFVYSRAYALVNELLSSGVLIGNADDIVDTTFSVARGIIYDWCLNMGSYSLVERGMKIINLTIDSYKPK